MILFNKFYKHFNILSITLVLVSIILLTFKGLNFGIDCKGGTIVLPGRGVGLVVDGNDWVYCAYDHGVVAWNPINNERTNN